MSVGIVCDGTAEAVALAGLVARMTFRSGAIALRPVYADMQPRAPPAQIIRAAKPKLELLRQRGARSFVVLIDRENHDDCPGVLAQLLEFEFSRREEKVRVVYKNRALENWLIADPRRLNERIPKINISDRLVRRIESAGADALAAHTLLNDSVTGGYSKRRDAIAICQLIRPDVAAANSRSFKKFASVCIAI